jgi:phosphatidylglycerol lysyltransferase
VPFIAAALFLVALWLLHRELADYDWQEIRQSFLALPRGRVLLAAVLTVVSYSVLTGHDFLAVYESLERRHWFTTPLVVFNRWVSVMVPPFFAATTFAGGVLLLLSGATSVGPGEFSVVRDVLPLPVVEASHFLGSLVGLGLVLLAAALQRRVDAAYHLGVGLLACGVVFSLLKGFDYQEAVLLALMLAALVPCRRHFYRHSA